MKQISFIISWLSVGLMLICLISGVIILYVYNPNLAYESVLAMSSLPYGAFFRKMHYFSGELFLVFSILHIAFELFRDSKRLTKFAWIAGIVAFICALVLMFSGYVLKGDLNANSAAQVAFALINNTPILDKFISFFRDFDQFYWRFFILHCIIFPAILLYFLKAHSKRIYTNYILVALALTMVFISFVDMPKDLDPLVMDASVSGPWFFLGGENLLIKGVSSVLVVMFLATPFVMLSLIPFIKREIYKKVLNLALIFWVIVYASCYLI